MIYENPTDKFRNELNPGERIIWSGQPQQGFILRPSDALMIPFSLVWVGFVVFWESTVISEGAPSFFALWGIPFVLMGLYMIFGRFFVDREQRRKSFYALTSERVIIISGLFNQNIKSLDIKRLPEINLNTKSNGKGTITFGPTHPLDWMHTSGVFMGRSRYPTSPSFELIDDVKTVYQQIKRLQRGEGV